MIKAYGLHWRADKVYWGWQNNSGRLLGATSRGARAHPIDFRMQRGIYALYADYELVYVGQTGGKNNKRLFDRLKDHLYDHLADRWNRFSWFGIQRVLKKDELSSDVAAVHASVASALNKIEAVAIAIAEPRLNLQRGKWGGEARQYFQYWDEDDSEHLGSEE